VIDNIVTTNPEVRYYSITAVVAPGPANKGNANGTTLDSSETVSPYLQLPCVSSSMETTKAISHRQS